MCAGSQITGWILTEHRHIESILCQLFQLVLDPTQRPCRIAREYFRIVQTIENPHDQNLAGLQIALNCLKTRPDFSQSVQRPQSLGSRLGGGRPYDMEKAGRVWSASADVRRLKAAKRVQDKNRFATL